MDTACDCSALQHCPFIHVLLKSCVLQSDTRTTVHPTLHQYTHYFFPIPTNPCCIYPHSVPHWSFPSPSPSPQYTQLHTNNMLYILKYILCGTCRCRFLQLQSIDRQQAVVVDAWRQPAWIKHCHDYLVISQCLLQSHCLLQCILEIDQQSGHVTFWLLGLCGHEIISSPFICSTV